MSMISLPTCRSFGLSVAILAGLATWPALSGAALAVPTLSASTTNSNAGFYRLSWRSQRAGTPVFELQEALTPAFRRAHTLYKGTDGASMVSGRKNGKYYYRVRIDGGSAPGPWSQAVAIRVRHLPLVRAFGFFAIGAAVFIATLVLVVVGNRRSHKDPG